MFLVLTLSKRVELPYSSPYGSIVAFLQILKPITLSPFALRVVKLWTLIQEQLTPQMTNARLKW